MPALEPMAGIIPRTPWWRDAHLRWLMGVTVGLRLLLAALWPFERCIRDECMYLFTAERMVSGLGMTPSNGWIWAPGQVALMALHDLVTGGYPATVKVTQSLLAGVGAVVLFRIGARVGERRGASVAAWLYALSPTFAFFASRLWSETTYSVLLLLALHGILVAREGGKLRPAAATGVLAGASVLLRGVATYMLPIFALGLVWGRWRERRAWLQAGLVVGLAVTTVLPYSLYASARFDTLIISDRTMGQMMWLGNNDFPPITFDYGNGQLSDEEYEDFARSGRPHCAPKDQPVARDACETAAGVAWIRAHPRTFVERVPLRLAQLMNPHSFLTRHLRTRGWPGLPDAVDEVLVVLVAAFSFVTVLGGALGAWGRRPGREGAVYLLVVGLTTAYHLAAIGSLAGLSRYRVPLDTLWLVFAGAFLAAPRATLERALATGWRFAGTALTLGVLLGLLLWFLPAGFPGWGTW